MMVFILTAIDMMIIIILSFVDVRYSYGNESDYRQISKQNIPLMLKHIDNHRYIVYYHIDFHRCEVVLWN